MPFLENKRPALSLVLAMCCMMWHGTYAAAETIEWQGYEIHFTTFSSLLIPPEIAAMHDIDRAKNRIVTNISILKEGEPQTAIVRGQNTNLLNQLYTMEFTEVQESSAVYYLANQLIDERDTLRFKIQLTPTGIDDTYEFEFMRTY